jgi:hypothetical protein
METRTVTTKTWTALAAVLAVAVAGCGGGEPADTTDEAAVEAYRQEIREWQQGRQEGLTREEGWLTLVGLHWLDDGTTTVGSDPMSDVVLPAEAPARVGTLVREEGEMELRLLPGVDAKVDGEPVRRVSLTADSTG